MRNNIEPINKRPKVVVDGTALIARAVSALEAPTAVLIQCEGTNGCSGVGMHERYMPLAINLATILPKAGVIIGAAMQIRQALVEPPVSDAVALLMVSTMLDSIGHKPKDAPETNLAALVRSIAAASNRSAACLDQWPTIPVPVSPLVLGMAIETLIQTQRFHPAPAELRAACVRCYRELRQMERRLEAFLETRQQVDDFLAKFAPEKIEPPKRIAACGTKPAKRTRAVTKQTGGRDDDRA
jgi:hypothetical protein